MNFRTRNFSFLFMRILTKKIKGYCLLGNIIYIADSFVCWAWSFSMLGFQHNAELTLFMKLLISYFR